MADLDSPEVNQRQRTENFPIERLCERPRRVPSQPAITWPVIVRQNTAETCEVNQALAYSRSMASTLRSMAMCGFAWPSDDADARITGHARRWESGTQLAAALGLS